MASVDVLVLGPVAIADERGTLQLPAKVRQLLAALAVRHGRACQVDEIIDALWGETPPVSAPKLLRIYVSQLRKALPPSVAVETTSGAYALHLPEDSLDAGQFERLLDEAEIARANGNPVLVAALTEEALALWRGHAYGDLAYREFARGEAERLEELRLTALEFKLEALLQLGRDEQVRAEARALASEQPLRELVCRFEMLALYRSGRQAEALDVYAALRRNLDEEVGLEPSAELRELQRRILNQDRRLFLAADDLSHQGLPASPNALVGRERDLDAVGEILARSDVRLLVLTGAGGSGKTRLALEVARRAASSFANGAIFVDLAPVSDASLVVTTIARAVGAPAARDASTATALAAALRSFELLLVLDNAEHLRDAAPLFADLVREAPSLTLVVTSRTVLHISGEHVFPVAPLSVDAAAELFRQRAWALERDADLVGENAEHVREICRRVDGLPLAIELAAARIGTLTPTALLERLDARLGVLTQGPRDLPARQQTLRETIDWSVGLLTDEERRALARLAVFPGSASLEAVEAVCEASLDTISLLVDHNLVQRAVVAGRPRLSLLEVVREYASELLAADGAELERTRTRLAEWCLALVEEAEAHLAGDRQTEWLDLLDMEHDSMRAALDHLDESEERELQLALAVLLSRFWYVRGYLLEGRRRLEGALAHAVDQPANQRRRASTAAASLALLQGAYDAARRFAEEALEAARACEEPHFVANALSNLGAILLAGGDHEGAASALEQAVQLGRETGDERITALAINNLGDLALTIGDYDRAAPLFEESLALLRKRNDAANIARSLFNGGAVDLMQGRVARAAARFRESLELSQTTGDREDIAWSLLGLAATDVEDGDGERAGLLLGAAREVLEQMDAAFKPFERELDRRTEERSRALCGAERHDAAVEQGSSLPLAEVIELALRPAARPVPVGA